MAPSPVPASEYKARRKKLRSALQGAVALVYAGDAGDLLHDRYHPHAHFRYLTGIENEPGAVLLLAPGHPVASRREMLFLPAVDSEMERWDGFRPRIGADLKEQTGFESIFRTYALPRFLTHAAKLSKKLACIHEFSTPNQPVSPDLAMFRKLAERIPGISIDDKTEAVVRMRAKKSRAELSLLQHAIDITGAAFDNVLRTMEPGMNEFAVQELLEHYYKGQGSRETGYGTIVGGGVNSTVAHYRANDQELQDGQLVCIDSGAAFLGYTADITRTFPVNGRFTDRQREMYDLVLKAQMAAIRAIKPGVTLMDVDAAARKIIEKAGYGDAYFHGIGHHLGLEVHDPSPEEPLREGAVVTIEPGVYLPDEEIGIRIEDDILVTKSGHKNLSNKIPKKAADIERIMAER